MGIQALERRSPPQGSALRTWLTGVRTAFAGRILPFTDNTAPVCASLHIPDPRSERDAMIAATAIEHRFTVVTRNTVGLCYYRRSSSQSMVGVSGCHPRDGNFFTIKLLLKT